MSVPDFPITPCFPFMSYPRFVDFHVYHMSSIKQFDFFLNTLASSLQPPATLEHLKLKCSIAPLDLYPFMRALFMLDAWTLPDGLATA
jgi:hypothetical protein